MNILNINTSDIGGGAEKVAFDLHNSYVGSGFNSSLAVGLKKSNGENVYLIQNNNNLKKQLPKAKILRYLWRLLTLDWPAMLRWLGFEDIYYPKNDLKSFIQNINPDIIHLHNLHGGYFDLHSLIELSKQYPVLINLHDEWLLTGHCAYTIECEKWKIGCGNCPDLIRYPGIRFDRTKFNYKIKQSILTNSHFSVASPSKWLMQQVDLSPLSPFSKRVIHNGIDQNIFNPKDRLGSRKKLGFDRMEFIILSLANQGKRNPYKDFDTIRKSIEILSERTNQNLTFISIGGLDSKVEFFNTIKFIEIPFIKDPAIISEYYKASDIFLHATLADNFPLTVLEALSCGTPVIATDIGGIPEQIINQETGFLVPPKDPIKMAEKIELLINEPEILNRMKFNAAAHSKDRFSNILMANKYLAYYIEIIDIWKQKHNDD